MSADAACGGGVVAGASCIEEGDADREVVTAGIDDGDVDRALEAAQSNATQKVR